MVGCFVPRCKSGHCKKVKCHLFRPARSAADDWIKLMHQVRTDLTFNPNNDNHRVCSNHFKENDILKVFRHLINGNVVEIPRDKWTLVPGAVPSVFNELPLSIRPKPPSSRPKRDRSRAPETNKKIKKRRCSPVPFDPLLPPTTPQSVLPSDDIISITKIVDWWTKEQNGNVNEWTLYKQTATVLTFQLVTFIDDAPDAFKTITVLADGDHCKLNLFIEKCLFLVSLPLYTFAEFSERFQEFISLATVTFQCRGVVGFEKILNCKGGILLFDTWYSTNCEKVSKYRVCLPCKLLYARLSKDRINTKSAPANNLKKIHRSLVYYKQKAEDLKTNQVQLQNELTAIQKCLLSANHETITSFLEQLNMPRPMKEGIMASIVSAQRKSAKGMKYSTCWLLESLMLRIKSPAAYNHLRDSKLLQLPHPRTLRKLIAGQPCEYGLNLTAIKAIETAYNFKERRDRQGVLIFDEIQLRETLEYNPHTYQLDGYIDYGEENVDLINDSDRTKLANHALVIMYRPLNDSWVQPVCAFATRNAAKGNAIYKVVIQTILKLESIGAEVLSVVCDGATPNKSFWKLCGIGEKNGEVTNKIRHPASDERYLYFTCDVPHLFKCIRNHMRKYTCVTFFDEEVDFTYYEKLLEEDQKQLYGLRKCPKFTRSHVWPNSFEKMNVPLVTQLFSRSVATGLQFYRNIKGGEFVGSESTEKCTLYLNNVFDSLNKFRKGNGIQVDSSEFRLLQEFSEKLNLVDTASLNNRSLDNIIFASKETFLALKITIKSTIEIIQFLVRDLGFGYVLTAKLNQDCLERFFGLIRAAGGHEEHPTISNFIQLFRLLSLYTPVKRCIRGNVRSELDEAVLVNLESDFRESSKKIQCAKQMRSHSIDEVIMEKLLQFAETEPTLTIADRRSDLLHANLVYFLSGYLCYRAKKLVSCISCSAAICAMDGERRRDCANFAKLVELLDYGTLHYPATHFFNCVSQWENSFCRLLDNYRNNGDIILTCLQSVDSSAIVSLGCNESGHNQNIVKILLPFYITMRIHFYTRSVRNLLGKGKATKCKRKESKLIS